MEPTVTAALIRAGVDLFRTFIEKWRKPRKTDNKQRKVNEWVARKYDLLRDSLSSDCVRLLKVVRDGKRQTVKDFLNVLYPKLSKRRLDLLKKEFRYRLEFMVLIGVLRYLPRVRKYDITRLGVAFLDEARGRGHYSRALPKK